jgi:hypothetical protein
LHQIPQNSPTHGAQNTRKRAPAAAVSVMIENNRYAVWIVSQRGTQSQWNFNAHPEAPQAKILSRDMAFASCLG